ncbi:DUF6069 family protein [Streptomyces sp. NPDC051976]|uniref:DUF6069 family protein n=1 Tax=Streptomyces sp. NPDC051976 TaxID=3154947 RepID=UPI00344A3622
MTTIRQTATPLPLPVEAGRARRRRERGGAVLSAAVATSAVWLVGHAFGVDYLLRDSMGKATITLPIVIGFTLVFGVLGWASLALLERFTRHARTAWTALAVAVALLSLLPILPEHATAGTKVTLALVHLTVAAVLVPVLRRTSGGRS